MNSNTVMRAAGIGCTAAIAIGFFSAGAANADTFVPLPDGSITETLIDGTVVTVSRVGESATISPSMGATPLHRNVWVSGKARVNLTGPHADGGKIEPGYVVACQLTLGGEAGGDMGMGMSWDSLATGARTVSTDAGTDGSITIGPGEAVNYKLLDLEKADMFGGESHSGMNSFTGNGGGVNWDGSTLGITGCAGYAQARSYVKVSVYTETVTSSVTLWGQPFSMG
jgi:hypothetical protein